MPRGCCSCSTALVLAAVVLLVQSVAADPGPDAPPPRPSIGSDTVKVAPGVCTSIDARSHPQSLAQLAGCRVIEGHLAMVLMERNNHTHFEKHVYPELREVTGYIKIYRVKNLRNLGDMFPNLSVVRGLQLFKDYAIVIFDNAGMESLGLRSLTNIERGAVRIQSNEKLCYTNTIDWNRINPDSAENNLIKANYDTRLCGLCPNAQGRTEDFRRSHLQCPSDDDGRLLCWDDQHCQKICPPECGDRPCMDDGTCCHQSCLGGCDGPSARNCHVCRRFSFGYNEKRTCVDRCPGGFYELFRRCVTEDECRSQPAPAPESHPESSSSLPPPRYKIFANTCVIACPTNYIEEGPENNLTCRPCPTNLCRRDCPGGKVDSVATAEAYKGCTHVTGSLEIALRSGFGNTTSILESSLGDIREIEGCLKVTRSYPLVTLTFFKNLKKIGGKTTKDDKTKVQSFYIFNNPNLELLWDFSSNRTIEITYGKVFIHFNPKLCYSKILPLKNMTKDPTSTFSEMEVSPENNGDQAACFRDTLKLTVSELNRNAVILMWDTYCLDDLRKLLGYSIYYIAAEKNVSLYGQRDACSSSWSVLDITMDDFRANNTAPIEKNPDAIFQNPCKNLQPIFYPLTQLVPYTRYAAYVKTYTTAQDKKGAQSPIIYFHTLPNIPSPPVSLSAKPTGPHSVMISWQPPYMPNGTIMHYHIEIQSNVYNKPKILAGNNDYCGNPSALPNLLVVRDESQQDKEEKTTGKAENGSCACKLEDDMRPSTRFSFRAEAEREESIEFENTLQNQVYVKNARINRYPIRNTSIENETFRKLMEPRSRLKRSTDDGSQSMLVLLSSVTNPQVNSKYKNLTDEDGYVKSLFYDFTEPNRTLEVTNMRHFTWYTVNIWACRNKHPNETQADYEATWCSQRTYYTFRTERLNSDMVSNVRAEIVPSNKTLPEINVTWEPPQNPNGFVVAYSVHHSRVEDKTQAQEVNHRQTYSCIASEEHKTSGGGYVLRNLAPGNYSIKVTPVTVAGAGNSSALVYVFVPERSSDRGYEWIWGVVGVCLIVILMLIGVAWYAKRSFLPQSEANKLFASVNPEYVSTVYVPDEWELPRSNVDCIRELGQGSFGMVYEGVVKNIEKGKPVSRCAVKTVNEHATDRERHEFLNEASVMKAFDTQHVVRLLGVVSRGQPTLVVMELMELGDLKTYLRSMRPDNDPPAVNPPSLATILQMAIEIADGMAYLSAKKFVHRDLAARNCMVAGDLTVKVGDFGMTRDIYETDYYRKGSKGLLPVRWMSPESLKDGVFSSYSDVWSFGVVLWEMATLAMQPYQGLSNEQVLRYVVEGGVMERPEHCPDRLYELMRVCWEHRPGLRPAFLRLVSDLSQHARPRFRLRSFFHSPRGQELFRALREEDCSRGSAGVGLASGSGSNLFGVSGRLASWVRELSSLRSRERDGHADNDADAALPLAPHRPQPPAP